ncbi:hypothetical protein C436_05390 [Haloarcula marismortui ATCC 33800]|uniref:Large ribosomal subunit protein uL15/eL18 domain-containing protein n=1 Tax=Haloarcula marismortui ATCC 33800 TaxID=662476 RepID=M0K317_9EURY|nr:hypothetical protein C436_05390 [Haloarcula sinaiiensis ATCC 33800]
MAVADGGVKQVGPSPKGIWKPDQDSPFYIDVREFHGDYEDLDQVKLLDDGRLDHRINVITDQCSEEAKHSIKSMGGKIYFTKKGRSAINKVEDVMSKRYFNNTSPQDTHEKVDKLDSILEKIESGQEIEFHEFETLIEHYDHSDRAEEGYEAMESYAQNLETVENTEAINLMRARDFAQVYGFSPDIFEEKLESYFEDIDVSEEYIRMQQAGLPEDLSIDNVLSGIDYIHQLHEGDGESDADQAELDDKIYLRAVDEQKSWI